MNRQAREHALVEPLALDGADPGQAVREPPLLPSERGEGRAVVVVEGLVARIEDELHSGAERVGAEDAVLAAVARVPAERGGPRHRHAVGRDEGDRPGPPRGR